MRNKTFFWLFFITIFFTEVTAYGQSDSSLVRSRVVTVDTIPLNQLKFSKDLEVFGIKLRGSNERVMQVLLKRKINSYEQLWQIQNFDDLEELNEQEKSYLRNVSFHGLLSENSEFNKNLISQELNTAEAILEYPEDKLKRIAENNSVSQAGLSAYLNRVRGLEYLEIQSQNRQRARSINPFYRSVTGEDAPCESCDPDTELFSPGVYLLYLLDFVEEAFANDTLNSLRKIDERFLTQFETIVASQDISANGTYIQHTNDVLENYVKGFVLGDNWRIDPNFGIQNHIVRKSEIYSLFNNPPTNRNTVVPFPGVIEDIYENYVELFGVDRKELLLIKRASSQLQRSFAIEKMGLNNDSRLQQNFNLLCLAEGSDDIDWEYIYKVKQLLREKIEMQFLNQLAIEQTTTIQELVRFDFFDHFRDRQNVEEERLMLAMFDENNIDNLNGADLDSALYAIQEQAASCVRYDFDDCPTLVVSNPITYPYPLHPAKEIFRKYHSYLATNPVTNVNGYVDQAYQMLENQIQNSSDELLTEEELIELSSSDAILDSLFYKIAEKIYQEQLTDNQFKASIENQASILLEAEWEKIIWENEAIHYKEIRANLLDIIFAYRDNDEGNGVNDVQKIQKFEDQLFFDLRLEADYKTPRLSFEINRIHSLIQKSRLGIASRGMIGWNNPAYVLNEPFRDDLWSWLQSYGTWHAAMMVNLYPENFLNFEYKRNKTPEFEAVIDSLESSNGELPDFRKQYLELVENSNLTIPLTSFEFNSQHFYLSYNPGNKNIYFSCSVGEEWRPWVMLDGMNSDNVLFEEIFFFQQENKLFLFSLGLFNRSYLYAVLEVEDSHIKVQKKWTKIDFDRFPLIVEQEEIVRPMDDFSVPDIVIPAIYTPITDLLSNSNIEHIYLRSAQNENENEFIIGFLNTIGELKIWEWEIRFGDDFNLSYIIRKDPSYNISDTNRSLVEKTKKIVTDIKGKKMLLYTSSQFSNDDAVFFEVNLNNQSIDLPANYDNKIEEISTVNMSSQKWDNIGISISDNETWYTLSRDNSSSSLSIIFRNPFYKEYLVGYSIKSISISENASKIFGIHGAMRGTGNPLVIRDAKSYATIPLKITAAFVNNWYRTLDELDVILMNSSLDYIDPARIYFDEYALFLPSIIAKQYSEKQEFRKAFETLSLIYNPFESNENIRSNYPYFEEEGSIQNFCESFNTPFDPFFKANLDKSIYLDRVKFDHIENLLDWADQLFTFDSPESVNRARELYELAGEILTLVEFPEDGCTEGLVNFFHNRGFNILNNSQLSSTIENIERTNPELLTEFETILQDKTSREIQNIYRRLERYGRSVGNYNKENSDVVTNQFSVMKLEGIKTTILAPNRSPITMSHLLSQQNQQTTQSAPRAISSGIQLLSQSINISNNALQCLNDVDVAQNVQLLELKNFCLPRNPLIEIYKYRIKSNLEKIRTNRNYGGYIRQMQNYATKIDPDNFLGEGGVNYEAGTGANTANMPPPIYRYDFLFNRAKYLASLASQSADAMLGAIENLEREEYTYLNAVQDLELQEGNIDLQRLRLSESNLFIEQAVAQHNKARFTQNRFTNLIRQGLNNWEKGVLVSQWAAVAAFTTATISSGIEEGTKKVASLGFAGQLAQISRDIGQTAQATASVLQTQASYSRRKQDWEFQRGLAAEDIKITDIGIDLAKTRRSIVGQESYISNLRLQFSSDNIEFLDQQFGNAALYDWMQGELRQLSQQQLNLAVSNAKAAELALEFQTKRRLNLIRNSYWDDERRGLLGAKKLQTDLEELEQNRLNENKRTLQITKVISLRKFAPEALSELRSSGIANFETQEHWFDRDYPGHYMRLIKSVNGALVALTSSGERINGTLIKDGISRVVINPNTGISEEIQSPSESVIFGSPNERLQQSGLAPLLNPFESTGVAGNWILEIPKGANAIDYNTIYDVILEINYTALEDGGLKRRVLDEMGQDDYGYVSTSANRIFSLRNEFPDAWYYLNNPILGIPDSVKFSPTDSIYTSDSEKYLKDYSLSFNLSAEDFLLNENRREISKITFIPQYSDEVDKNSSSTVNELHFQLAHVANDNTSNPLTPYSVTIGESLASLNSYNAISPYGYWAIQIQDGTKYYKDSREYRMSNPAFDISMIKDIIMVIEYKAKVHYPR